MILSEDSCRAEGGELPAGPFDQVFRVLSVLTMPKWKYPVTIADIKGDRLATISSTEEAREFLVSNWPAGRGRAYLAAVKVCSLESRIANDVARVSFVLAADEAGMSAIVETGIRLS